ncbi:MAG: heme exporter protein CcmD [Phaeospirillum sp.]|nr:heme exporter protein CcmD [Phaeospirillum sp.]
METISGVLQMGGYGGYVWPAYGVSAVVLVLVLVASLISARHAEAELEQLQLTRRARRGAGRDAAAPDTAMVESPE